MRIDSINRIDLYKNVNVYLNLISDWKYCNWKEENFLYDLPKKWLLSFAVYDQNDLTGFCIASNKIPNVYYIHLIFISGKSRGQSLGTTMLEQAKKTAMEHHLDRIELRCPESNTGALAFYQKKGFVITQKLKDETSGNEMDYYLRLALSPNQ